MLKTAIGNASAKGALVKGGKYIEAIGQIKAVAMDKTRTLTYGKPKVTDVIPFGETTREHLLACSAGIETYSEHPLAQAIVTAANAEKIDIHAVENFQAVMGKGAKADCVVCYDKHHCIGKLPFITEEHSVQDEVVKKVEALQRQGKTSIVISSNDSVEGIIALTDVIKTESKEAVTELLELGKEFCKNIKQHIETEIETALELIKSNNLETAFYHLERAHVLGQAITIEHTRVHWLMLKIGWRKKDVREIFGQILRIVGASTKTPFGIYPTGNTGGANVWFFKPMPILDDLNKIILQSNERLAK